MTDSPKRHLMAAVDPEAVWWHTAERDGSVYVSKKALGEFFYAILHRNVKVGDVWPFAPVRGSLVLVSVKMTPAVKDEIEATTRFRFVAPPVSSLTMDWRCDD